MSADVKEQNAKNIEEQTRLLGCIAETLSAIAAAIPAFKSGSCPAVPVPVSQYEPQS